MIKSGLKTIAVVCGSLFLVQCAEQTTSKSTENSSLSDGAENPLVKACEGKAENELIYLPNDNTITTEINCSVGGKLIKLEQEEVEYKCISGVAFITGNKRLVSISEDNQACENLPDNCGTIVSTQIKGESIFNTIGNHTFTVPDLVTTVNVTVVGGGGAAGQNGAHTTSTGSTIFSWGGGGGGGGAGGRCFVNGRQVNPGEALNLTVGSGGAGVAYVNNTLTWNGPNASGGNGASSSFVDLVATGGLGGTGGSGSYRIFNAGTSGVGGPGGAGGQCQLDAVASPAGGNGMNFQQVAEMQAYTHADGGIGGGVDLAEQICGKGASADLKEVNSAVSNNGENGCVIVSWDILLNTPIQVQCPN